MRSKTIVSAGVTVFLNGKPFGRVKSFRWDSSTPRMPKYGIDSPDPYELIPTTTRITGQLAIYRTVGDGGIEGAGLAADYEDLPREKYFRLQLIERLSDTIVFEANYCSVVRQAWSVPERGMITGEVEFEALDWSNEMRSQA